MKEFIRHPCFNEKARHEYGRVHLPIAPKCNIQCNFCDRKFDCINESRPGVSSVVLSPYQALAYLEKVLAVNRNISVVGIAGPGDPFANAQETCATLRLVRERYPEILLCVATNGLAVAPYVDELAKIKVSHVTITMNAVDAQIGGKIYAWAREGKNIYRKIEAAQLLLERQLKAIKALKDNGITVKINSIIIPGINVTHIKEIAKKVSEYGVDIINPIPLYAVKGTVFEDLEAVSAESVTKIRKEALEFLPVMSHCGRCRADAVGLLNEELTDEAISLLQSSAALPLIPEEARPFVAAASREGVLVNSHLGGAEEVYVYKQDGSEYVLVDVRQAPQAGGGNQRWMDLAALLSDCQAILVARAGRSPRELLHKTGIKVVEMQGLIKEGLRVIFGAEQMPASLKPLPCDCASSKLNKGGGCGEGRGGCG